MGTNLPYPYRPTPRERSASYVQVNHTYYHQLNELNHSIWVRGPGLLQQWDISVVLGFFMGRFGGDLEDYPTHRCHNRSFLVRIPNHINRMTVIEQLGQWAWRGNLTLQPWLQEVSLNIRPRSHRIKIRIVDFPFPIWHRDYIVSYIQELGEVETVDDRSHRRDYIEAWLRCQDPNEIPSIGTIHFDQFWGECRISVIDWGDYQPPPGPGNQGSSIGNNHLSQGGQPEVSQEHLSTGGAGPRNGIQPTGFFSSSGESADPSWYVETEQAHPLSSCRPHAQGPDQLAQQLQCNKGGQSDKTAAMIRFGTMLPVEVSLFIRGASKKGEKETCWDNQVPLKEQIWERKVVVRIGTILIQSDQSLNEWGQKVHQGTASLKPEKNLSEVGLKEGLKLNLSSVPTKGMAEGTITYCNHTNLLRKTLNSQPLHKTQIQATLFSQNQKNSSLLGPTPKQISPNKQMGENTDELALMFATLQAGNELALAGVDIPQQGISQRNWDLAVVAKVVSDRQVYGAQFVPIMVKAWGVHPETKFNMVGRNTYLIDFYSESEKTRVMNRAPWLYRGDIIAMRRARDRSDLSADAISTVDLWTQLHNIPPESVNKEGAYLFAATLGKPISDARQTSQNGKIYWRIRLNLPIDESLQDTKTMNHPTLGPIKVYLVYERTGRVCEYCGCLGHEISSCPKYAKVLSMAGDPYYADRPELAGLLNFRWGVWVTSASFVPRQEEGEGSSRAGSVPPGFGPRNMLNTEAQSADSEMGGAAATTGQPTEMPTSGPEGPHEEEQGRKSEKGQKGSNIGRKFKIVSNRVRARNSGEAQFGPLLMLTQGQGGQGELQNEDGSSTSAKRFRAASPKSPPRAQ